jgi:hypothetical protein
VWCDKDKPRRGAKSETKRRGYRAVCSNQCTFACAECKVFNALINNYTSEDMCWKMFHEDKEVYALTKGNKTLM